MGKGNAELMKSNAVTRCVKRGNNLTAAVSLVVSINEFGRS